MGQWPAYALRKREHERSEMDAWLLPDAAVCHGAGRRAPVKKSRSGICHPKGGTYYSRTRHYIPYDTMQACLDSGAVPSALNGGLLGLQGKEGEGGLLAALEADALLLLHHQGLARCDLLPCTVSWPSSGWQR